MGYGNREGAVTIDPNYRAVSFHAQQCGEKYLKAYLQEKSLNPERTHDLSILLTRVLTYEPTWINLEQACLELTEFAVDHRYPGTTTSVQDASDSLHYAESIRNTVRHFFGLPL